MAIRPGSVGLVISEAIESRPPTTSVAAPTTVRFGIALASRVTHDSGVLAAIPTI